MRAQALASVYPIGGDELHWTGGLGLVPTAGFQVDAAFDFIDSDRYTLSLSGVARF